MWGQGGVSSPCSSCACGDILPRAALCCSPTRGVPPPGREEQQMSLWNEPGLYWTDQCGEGASAGEKGALMLPWSLPLAKPDPQEGVWGGWVWGGYQPSADLITCPCSSCSCLNVLICHVRSWSIRYQSRLETNGIIWHNIMMNQLCSSGELAGADCALTCCSQFVSKAVNTAESSLSEAVLLHQALTIALKTSLVFLYYCVTALTWRTDTLVEYHAGLFLAWS